jgi:hypothetical protein
MARSAPEHEGVSRRVRVFVTCFLAVFLSCGILGIEAWPLTGFKLFSQVRADGQPGWEAMAVDGSGKERLIDFASLGRAFRGGLGIMRGLPAVPPDRRLATCRAWLGALQQRDGDGIAGVRIYRTVWAVPRRGGGPVDRTLYIECR